LRACQKAQAWHGVPYGVRGLVTAGAEGGTRSVRTYRTGSQGIRSYVL